MNTSLRSFYINLAVFSIFTLGILICWQRMAPARFQTNADWGIWAFFIVSTLLIHLILMRVATDAKKFIRYFMGITGIKLLTYLLIILIYSVLNKETALAFALFFLCMYVLYSGLEVFTLLKRFRK
jgi:hypothetical protein